MVGAAARTEDGWILVEEGRGRQSHRTLAKARRRSRRSGQPFSFDSLEFSSFFWTVAPSWLTRSNVSRMDEVVVEDLRNGFSGLTWTGGSRGGETR